MIAWGYWRWQVMRSLPLAAAVALLIAAAGWAVREAIPTKYTASARIILERQIGVPGTAKAQRTAEDVQQLQIVLHEMKTQTAGSVAGLGSGGDPAALDLKIETSRDKPTYLHIETRMPTASAAIALAQSVSDKVITLHDGIQQAQIDASLGELRDQLETHASRLNQARDAQIKHQISAPSADITTLLAQANMLQRQLRADSVDTTGDDPALAKLYAELSVARAVYSDLHPKVRLIRARISRQASQSPASQLNSAAQKAIEDRLLNIDAQIAAVRAYQAEAQVLERNVATAATAEQIANDALNAAQRLSDTGRMRLKLVESASLNGSGQQRMRMATALIIGLIAAAAALAAVLLRIKFDTRLRRPVDLQRALGLTPFATLPDLGPSLS